MSTREPIRDNAGHVLYVLEHNDVEGRTYALTPGGQRLGYFDQRMNETRTQGGRRLGSGNQIGRLVEDH